VRRKGRPNHVGMLTYAWCVIEKSLRNAAPYEVRSQTIDEVIDYHYESGRLSLAQRDRLHRLRKLRNVHTHQMSTDQLAILVDDVTAMQNSLQMGFLHR
jgi:hypothetical protein